MIRKTAIFLLLLSACSFSLWAQKKDALELYRQGDYSQAVDVCLQELKDLAPSQLGLRMNAYTVLGWSYIGLKQYNRALESATKARSESRYDIRIIEIAGEANYYLGRDNEALNLFEEYIALNEDSPGDRIELVYYFMGEIFLRLSEFNHADIAFSTAVHYSPQSARWWARLGYAREQIPDSSAAQEAYSKALELQPSLEEAQAGLDRLGIG